MTPSASANEHTATARASSLPKPIRAGAFWLAVLLPFLSVGLLIGGIGTTIQYLLFIALVTANIVALIAGHGYGR